MHRKLTQKSKSRNTLNSLWYQSLNETVLPVSCSTFGNILKYFSIQVFEPKYFAVIEMIENKFNGKSMSMASVACCMYSFKLLWSDDDPETSWNPSRMLRWTFLRCMSMSSKHVNSVCSSNPNIWQYFSIKRHVSLCSSAYIAFEFPITSFQSKSEFILTLRTKRKKKKTTNFLRPVRKDRIRCTYRFDDKRQLTESIWKQWDSIWHCRLDANRMILRSHQTAVRTFTVRCCLPSCFIEDRDIVNRQHAFGTVFGYTSLMSY